MLLVARLLTPKTFYTPTLSFETFLKDRAFCTRSYRNESHYKDTFQNQFQKHIPQTPFKLFSKPTVCTRSYRNENHYKDVFKILSKPTPQAHFQTNQLLQKETKSPQITMYEKGANTFHFLNLPPELKKISQSSFLFFSPFTLLDKRKVSGESCYPQQL